MKLNFTRKTWYFFLLASAAVSMLNGFFVLAGQTFGLLEQIAFCLAAIAALFLAAEKGAPAKDKRNYFLVFLLLLFSYMINGWLGYLCSAGWAISARRWPGPPCCWWNTSTASPSSGSFSWWASRKRSTCCFCS